MNNLNKNSRISLTAGVLKLREELTKSEDFSSSEQNLNQKKTEAIPTKVVPIVPSESKASVSHSVEDCKTINVTLENEQVNLKRELNQSIKQGRISEAEKLSDQLSLNQQQQAGNKAAIVYDYLKRKQEKDEEKAKKKRKKLNWGFETKKKWETKSSM